MLSPDYVRQRLLRLIAATRRDVDISKQRVIDHPDVLSTSPLPNRIARFRVYIDELEDTATALDADISEILQQANRVCDSIENALRANSVDVT